MTAQCSHTSPRGTRCRVSASDGATCKRHSPGYVRKPLAAKRAVEAVTPTEHYSPKAAKLRAEPASVLPGLEGYAKRDVSLGQWDTHPDVARAFVRWCGIAAGDRVLEPSAGIGNVARALSHVGADLTCVELDVDRAAVLRSRFPAAVHTADFLAMGSGAFGPRRFDSVAMNPPYEADGETRHLLHALRFADVARGIVRLVALASASRADAWRSVMVTRVAVLVPRPVFAGSSGMDEIAFVEIVPRREGLAPGDSAPLLAWLDWRAA